MNLPLALALLSCACSHVAYAAVSVTEFGAKGDGDGDGVADDTRAIQEALDTGKNVIIPEGTWRITNALQPKPNQVIELIREFHIPR